MPSCKIIDDKFADWEVSGDVLCENILPLMFENYECAGSMTIGSQEIVDCSKGSCKKRHHISSTIEKINKGNATSVKTTDGYLNFHTHPFPCYKGENTVWGWPSGEDMRECIGFGMRENLVHMVFTLEGTYIIQLNPNVLSFILYDLKDVGINGWCHDTLRGLFASIVESYFKCTHGHRTQGYNVKFGTKSTSNKPGICMPEDWVKYANSFRLGNILGGGKNKCSDMLPCNGFPDFTSSESFTMGLEEFIEGYGIDMYKMCDRGRTVDVGTKKKNMLEVIERLVELFDGIDNKIQHTDETWKRGQVFNVRFVPNMFTDNGVEYDYTKFIRKMCCEGKSPLDACKHIRRCWDNCETGNAMIKFVSFHVRFHSLQPTGSKSCKFDEKGSKRIRQKLHKHSRPNNRNGKGTRKK